MTTIITFECGIHQAKSFKHINVSIHLLRIFFYYKNDIFLKMNILINVSLSCCVLDFLRMTCCYVRVVLYMCLWFLGDL